MCSAQINTDGGCFFICHQVLLEKGFFKKLVRGSIIKLTIDVGIHSPILNQTRSWENDLRKKLARNSKAQTTLLML
tara:strand:- start:234 stop:461 length:228 start_codon:yes stop_codon:yes gene_type:complete